MASCSPAYQASTFPGRRTPTAPSTGTSSVTRSMWSNTRSWLVAVSRAADVQSARRYREAAAHAPLTIADTLDAFADAVTCHRPLRLALTLTGRRDSRKSRPVIAARCNSPRWRFVVNGTAQDCCLGHGRCDTLCMTDMGDGPLDESATSILWICPNCRPTTRSEYSTNRNPSD
jgi:hypothetical protein